MMPDWSIGIDRLIRYYFPVLILLPVILTFIYLDKRISTRNKDTVLVLTFMLLTLISEDVINETLSSLPSPTPWRTFNSALGFALRPVCLLTLILESVPNLRSNLKKFALLCTPAVVNALVFGSALFTDLPFYIDKGNHYHRGPLFPVVIVVSIFYMLMLAHYSISQVQKRSRRKAIVILVLTIACFTAAIMEMVPIAYPTPLLNQTIAIGTVLYLVINYMVTSETTIENIQLSLLLMQIRPHFINNSLAAIRGMIRRDPEKAAEALNHFSGYLQSSMNSVLKTNLIPLSQEMELIDNYLYMENTRFRNSITVHKELAPVDFPVPPLTIQPLVENAVRHGLHGIQTPGELTIRTEIDSREYRVIVIDNGCGFDTTQPPDPRREHVGIKNVRHRLDILCSGTLSIESEPGKGTVSTVHIPAKVMKTLQTSA